MADRRRPRAKTEESDSGIDVWLPALVAIFAALFMLMNAHAEEGGDPGVPATPPHILFDAGRFDPGAIERDAAAAAIARGDYAAEAAAAVAPRVIARHVIVAVLPDIAAASSATLASASSWSSPLNALVPNPATNGNHDTFERLFALGAISGLLILTLLVLARTWRRTQDPTAV